VSHRTVVGCVLLGLFAIPSAVAGDESIFRLGPAMFGTLGDAVCNAEGISLGPKGTSIIFKNQVRFPDTTQEVFYQGAAYVSPWPQDGSSNRVQLLSLDLRTLVFTSVDQLLAVNFAGNLEVFERKSGESFEAVGAGRFRTKLGQGSYLSVSGNGTKFFVPSLERAQVELRSEDFIGTKVLRQFVAGPNTNDGRFLPSSSDNGHVARLLFEGEVYDVGSVDGQNLVIKFPNGEIHEVGSQVDRYSFSDLSLGREANGKLVLLAEGLEIPFNEHSLGIPRHVEMYSRRVADATTGGLLWRFNPSQVQDVDTGRTRQFRLVEREVKRWIDQGWFVKDIAVDTESQRTGLLFGQIEGKSATYPLDRTALVLFENKKRLAWRCRREIVKTENKNSSGMRQSLLSEAVTIDRLPKAEFRTTFSELSNHQHNHRIGMWTIYPKHERGMLIQLRGGSASNLLGQQLTEMDKLLLRDGWRLVRFEYSGATNTGVDVYSRLSFDIDNALRNDAKLIAQTTSRVPLNEPIMLEAVSFGGRLAPFVIDKIGHRLNGAILRAPYAKWRPPNPLPNPENWTVAQRSQLQFDIATYGAPANRAGLVFNSWTNKVSRLICNRENIHLFFGEKDDFVKAEDWQDACGPRISSSTLVNVGHDVGASPEYQTEATRIYRSVLPEHARPSE
jgi:hypothetical protein